MTSLDLATIAVEGATAIFLLTTMLVVVIRVHAITAGMRYRRVTGREELGSLPAYTWRQIVSAWRRGQRRRRRW